MELENKSVQLATGNLQTENSNYENHKQQITNQNP